MPQPGEPLGAVEELTGVTGRQLQAGAAKGALWTAIHTVVSLPVALLTNIVVARLLGVAEFGSLAVLTTIQGIAVAALGLGSGAALVQFGSKWFAAGRVAPTEHLVSRVQGLQILVTMPLLTIVYLAIADLPPWGLAVLLVLGVAAPTTIGVALDCLLIENRSAAAARITMVVSLASQGVIIVVAVWARQSDAVWASRVAFSGLVVLSAALVIAPGFRRALRHPRWPRKMPAGFWKFAVTSMVSGLVSMLVMSRTEVFVLDRFRTTAEVGIFALAFGLSAHVFAPAQAIVNPLVPAISAIHELSAAGRVERAFLRTMRTASTASGFLVAVAMPAVAILVPTIYGHSFASAAPVVMGLGAAGGIALLTGPTSTFILARLAAAAILKATVAALVLNVGLALVLVPLWGVWGAVVANIAGALGLTALMLWLEVGQLEVSWSLVVRSISPSLAGAGVGCAVFVLGRQIPSPMLGWLVAAVVGAVVYVGVLRVSRTGLTSDDAKALVEALPRRLQRAAGSSMRLVTAVRQ
ncbi:MAG: polysaccharide biosynthesis C-terminal domain-containing protein [Nostocoides sp.]